METVHTPNVFINPQMPSTGGKRPGFNLKYLFVFLGIVILAEVIFGLKTLFSSNLPPANPSSAALPATASLESSGKMALSSSQKEYKVGDTIAVAIAIDTSDKSADGVDAVLRFDPNVLDAEASSVTKGAIFADYPVTKISPDGVVRITALSSLQGQGFSGSGTLATLNFKAKAAGNPKLTWDFTLGATADSNIFSAGVADDMLKTVGGLEVVVK